MKQNFTPNDLIRFIYHEVTPDEGERIRKWVSENPDAATDLNQLMEVVTEMDLISMQPSESSIGIILDYSRENVEEASHA